MRIGFDAKRAFQNSTGLGHYSRTLISSLAEYYHDHQYYLFAPKPTSQFDVKKFQNITTISPEKFPFNKLRSLWRSFALSAVLEKQHIDIFHGLSHEIPVGIQHTSVRSVVTMHDLIFERYPQQFKKIDVLIYRRKFKYACKNADAIIAISEQTKSDLVQLYKVPEEKISVCYQSCNSIYSVAVPEIEKEKIRALYNLPEKYFLNVGSVIERKNLLTICKAINLLKEKLAIPLVVIGTGGTYKKMVKEYIAANNLEKHIIFLSENEEANSNTQFKNSDHFPAIYQMAEAMIYPSTFEGFGIPILEALFSRLPVITSNVSCMPEAGGNAAAYIEPFDYKDLAKKMLDISSDQQLAASMAEKGWEHAQKFLPNICAANVMDVYKKLMQ